MGPCDWLEGGWFTGWFYPIHQPRVRPLFETGLAFLSLLLLCPHQPAHLSAQSHSTLKAQVSPPPGGILIVPSPVLIIRVFCVSSLPSNSQFPPTSLLCQPGNIPGNPESASGNIQVLGSLEQGSANICKGPDRKYFLL